MTLSYLGLQNHIPTTENPLDFSGEKANTQKFQGLTKKAQNEAKQGLTGGGRPPTLK